MRQFLQTILKSGATVAPSSTKTIAKERLQIILAHQRGSQALAGVDLGALQEELLACVQRHIAVAQGEKVNIAVKQEGSMDIFEMQVPVSAALPRVATP
ncbi:hypothetical protein ACHHYP_03420 [Achlya hypogyna]|uniref:Cell division topological specificity factor MinE n=1 Tax=Achlya hypogyna TaxID=1202772 RepID=A0A1V9ZRA2_ACHHY|nr:hypothetical protein ACHHYP_03420 [Achlya hypogyna]